LLDIIISQIYNKYGETSISFTCLPVTARIVTQIIAAAWQFLQQEKTEVMVFNILK
jgi:hypothetical protein